MAHLVIQTSKLLQLCNGSRPSLVQEFYLGQLKEGNC